MQDLVIQPQEGKKGRSFRATCVAVIKADALFPEGGGNTIRPVWAMFAGSDAELKPFAANLKLGRKAEKDSDRFSRKGDAERFEFLKSVGYHMAWQREAEGSLVTLYHPELFRLDPGMVDPRGLKFVMAVPKYWADQQQVDVREPVLHVMRINNFRCSFSANQLAQWVPIAYLFAAYVDRRTRCPLIADGRFYLQLLIAAFSEGLASLPGVSLRWPTPRDDWGYNKHHGLAAEGLEHVGLSHLVSVMGDHANFESFLAEQVALFFDHTGDFVSVAQRVDLSAFEEML